MHELTLTLINGDGFTLYHLCLKFIFNSAVSLLDACTALTNPNPPCLVQNPFMMHALTLGNDFVVCGSPHLQLVIPLDFEPWDLQ